MHKCKANTYKGPVNFTVAHQARNPAPVII